jgi:hypothetical protein
VEGAEDYEGEGAMVLKINVNSMDIFRFGGMKEAVYDRDGYRCVKCGIDNESHKLMFQRNLTVDHIDHDRSNNRLDNLQTLCCHCHGRKDSPLKKYCIRGHEFTPENTRISSPSGIRKCRACCRIHSEKSNKIWAERKREWAKEKYRQKKAGL